MGGYFSVGINGHGAVDSSGRAGPGEGISASGGFVDDYFGISAAAQFMTEQPFEMQSSEYAGTLLGWEGDINTRVTPFGEFFNLELKLKGGRAPFAEFYNFDERISGKVGASIGKNADSAFGFNVGAYYGLGTPLGKGEARAEQLGEVMGSAFLNFHLGGSNPYVVLNPGISAAVGGNNITDNNFHGWVMLYLGLGFAVTD